MPLPTLPFLTKKASILLLSICVLATVGSAQELTFKKLKKNRNLVLRECSLIPEANRAIVLKGGNRVRLPAQLNRKAEPLGAKYKYFACDNSVNEFHPLHTKVTESSTPVEFQFSEESFEENSGGGGAGLNAVCPNIRELSRSEIWKTRGSHHFSDCRRNTVGFIVARGGPGVSSSCITIYNSAGREIHRLGGYFPAGFDWASRHYSCIGCSSGGVGGSSLAALARQGTNSSEIYLKTGTNTCVRIPDANRCYNSSSC